MTGGSMTKAELVEEVSRVSDLTKKHSEVIVDTVFKSIIDALHRGEKIELRGLRQLPAAQARAAQGPQPEDGRQGGRAAEEGAVLQAGKELKELINREPDADGVRRQPRRAAGRDGDVASRPRPIAWPIDDGTPLVSLETGLRDGRDRRQGIRLRLLRRRRAGSSRDDLVLVRRPLSYVILNLLSLQQRPPDGRAQPPRRQLWRRRRADELAELMRFTRDAEMALTEAYQPQGINVGINLGRPAGAGIVDHLHVHLVPRWTGDTNFMSVVGNVRVLPEELAQTAERLRPIFERLRRRSTARPRHAVTMISCAS